MIVADTSVLVPAVLADHEAHAPCREAAGIVDGVVGHALLELYSVLTRLPYPFTITPDDAAAAAQSYGGNVITLDPTELTHALLTLAEHQVVGGAVYDALIGLTAKRYDAVLLTRDERAASTYTSVGVDIRWVDT